MANLSLIESNLADRPFGGTGQLTDKMINKFWNYFALAICKCRREPVCEMKKAVGTVLFHCFDGLSLHNRYMITPRTCTNWCKYQAGKIDITATKHTKINLDYP